MRIAGWIVGFKRINETEYTPGYVLGNYREVAIPGPVRSRITIEIDAQYVEGSLPPQAGMLVDVNIDSGVSYNEYSDRIEAPRAEISQSQRAAENIRTLADALAAEYSIDSATNVQLDAIARDVMFLDPHPQLETKPSKEPEPPKELTRWSFLEID